MNHIHQSLAAGLWFVGVPIGTARDITLRALDVLASADLLVAIIDVLNIEDEALIDILKQVNHD